MIVKSQVLSKFWHKYILGQKRCPECGEWMSAIGIDMLDPRYEEFWCKKCDKYFYY